MSNKLCTLFEDSKGVELRLRGYQSHAFNLAMSIEYSNVEQRVYFVRGLQRRSRALIKGRLFEGSIDFREGSVVYFIGKEDC